jgi:hypothetical protein
MRLIDADALENICAKNSITDKVTVGEKTVLQHLKDAPTIDAVPVVRCAECKWFDKGGNGVAPICARHSGLAGAHDRSFCSYGERRSE